MIFKIYFDQINQEMYELEAEKEKEAIKKAQRNWTMIHRDSYPSYIEKS